MFRIKICGVTTVEDAILAAAAGADAVGLNFYPLSPRFVNVPMAEAIVHALPSGIARVGLFVNREAHEIRDLFGRLGLDLIQLHGDESPGILAALGGLPLMRSFRLKSDGLESVLDYLSECRQLNCLPERILLDACKQGHYGGTGELADWATARQYPAASWHPPLVLAGGLTPGNVAEAITMVRPSAVDIASGVERSPGRKDPRLVEDFVRAAREAFAALPT
ncbi:MAG: phosphoribosylanthranilate isomerase [Thermoguttaceae bacterium]